MWYQHLRAFMTKEMDMEWCSEQPCLARNEHCCVLVHVGDILFVGQKKYWIEFLEKMKSQFAVNHSELQGPGGCVTFLRRKMTELEDGMLLTPGTSVEKVISAYEKFIGQARAQVMP